MFGEPEMFTESLAPLFVCGGVGGGSRGGEGCQHRCFLKHKLITVSVRYHHVTKDAKTQWCETTNVYYLSLGYRLAGWWGLGAHACFCKAGKSAGVGWSMWAKLGRPHGPLHVVCDLPAGRPGCSGGANSQGRQWKCARLPESQALLQPMRCR